MAIISERSGGLFVRDDDEDLFSRDINGQLVRVDAPTEADYEKQVTLQIDGQPITENLYRYQPFKMFSADAEIKFTEIETPPPPPAPTKK